MTVDYVFGGQEAFDQIITTLMNLHDEQNKPPPASQSAIDNLIELKYSAGEESRECPICQDEYSPDESLLKLPCKHIYHPTCIKEWLRINGNVVSNSGTCPVCRFSLVEKDETTQERPIVDEVD